LYVYFTYGMWHCANIVCEAEGSAAGVLLRAALASTGGLRLSGPGLLCQGLELTREHNGLDVLDPASQLRLERPAGWRLPPVEWTRRVGFSFESHLPWRAVWRGHPAVSPGRPGVVLKRKDRSGG
jgi:DNA-3-methyladenine glycosylase